MSSVITQSKKCDSKKEIRHRIATENEFMTFCPKCCALETICLLNGTLVQTKKFSQVGMQIYHDCGSAEPCYLYRTG
jgi:hypothetical protein